MVKLSDIQITQPEGPVSLKLRFLAKINLINVLSHDALAGKPRERKKKEAGGEQTAKMRLTNLTVCVCACMRACVWH